MKKCNKCNIEKLVECFSGKMAICNQCNNERMKEYRCRNKETVKESKRKYHIRNKDKLNKKTREWRKNNTDKVLAHKEVNKEKIKNQQKQYRAKNRAKLTASENMRQASKRKAMPVWASKEKIQSYYEFARWLKMATFGNEYHVDHIVPLRGKNVCGLHVQNNLQILRASDNRKKYNKF